jgi:flagellar motility protein MotE (MotC chaperone)
MTASAAGKAAASPPRPAASATPVAAAHKAVGARASNVHQIAAFKRLGKVLAAMKPEDAVKVVAYMHDDEIVGILSQLAPKDAAALLTALPQERAGTLGRELLAASMASDTTPPPQP